MATSANRHGLSRTIPTEVAREVRQRSGFGCVLCGLAIYQYEHVDPPFADAQTHDPSAITLLCGACHDRVTRGLLSKETVKRAMATPRPRQVGYSFGPFDIGPEEPSVLLGTLLIKRTPVLIRAFGTPLLSMLPPEVPGGPFRLSALFCGPNGEQLLTITENEWQAQTDNWDVDIEGPRLTIRNAPRTLVLRIRADPPRGIVIERLAMWYGGAKILCDEPHTFRVQAPDGKWLETMSATIEDSDVAIEINEHCLDIAGNGSLFLGDASGGF